MDKPRFEDSELPDAPETVESPFLASAEAVPSERKTDFNYKDYMKDLFVAPLMQAFGQYIQNPLDLSPLQALGNYIPVARDKRSWAHAIDGYRGHLQDCSQNTVSPLVPLAHHLNGHWFRERGCLIIPKIIQNESGTVVRLNHRRILEERKYPSPITSSEPITVSYSTRLDPRLPVMQTHSSDLTNEIHIDSDEMRDILNKIELFTDPRAHFPTEPKRYTQAQHSYVQRLYQRYKTLPSIRRSLYVSVLHEELRHSIDTKRLPFDIRSGVLKMGQLLPNCHSFFSTKNESQMNTLLTDNALSSPKINAGKLFGGCAEVSGKLGAAATEADPTMQILHWKLILEQYLAYRPRRRSILNDLKNQKNLPEGMRDGGHEMASTVNIILLSNALAPQLGVKELPVSLQHHYDHEELVKRSDKVSALPGNAKRRALEEVCNRELSFSAYCAPFKPIEQLIT